MIRPGAHGILSIPTTTLDRHLHQNHRRRRRKVRWKEMPRRCGSPNNRSCHADATTNSTVGGTTTDHIGWVRPFLDRVLGRRADDIDLLGITRR